MCYFCFVMITRTIEPHLRYVAKKFPVVSLTGPRQSGKTTLLKKVFAKHPYVSLEDPDQRHAAMADPRGFLNQFKKGVILDEVQHVPELFSYIQTLSDEKNKAGFYILSGSQNFLMNKHISQSLAGRAGVLKLLPFSMDELKQIGKLPAAHPLLFQGFYPRLIDKKIKPSVFYSSYVETYLKRDVRDLINVGDMSSFLKFIMLCSGRVGQVLNLSSLSVEAGVAVNTIKAWLSVLEASYVIFLLQPYHQNFNKRLVKSPKLYFWDTGLACYLLGIKSAAELSGFHATGSLFENMVIADLGKHFFNQAQEPQLYFWRDKTGHELDCIMDIGRKVKAIEIKSGMTMRDDFLKGLYQFHQLHNKAQLNLIYGGNMNQQIKDTRVISWNNSSSVFDEVKK